MPIANATAASPFADPSVDEQKLEAARIAGRVAASPFRSEDDPTPQEAYNNPAPPVQGEFAEVVEPEALPKGTQSSPFAEVVEPGSDASEDDEDSIGADKEAHPAGKGRRR